jgi:hypothetical protein
MTCPLIHTVKTKARAAAEGSQTDMWSRGSEGRKRKLLGPRARGGQVPEPPGCEVVPVVSRVAPVVPALEEFLDQPNLAAMHQVTVLPEAGGPVGTLAPVALGVGSPRM